MEYPHWISDTIASERESELRQAFGMHDVIERSQFDELCDEIYCYYELRDALPYVLIGLLCFGVRDIDDVVQLNGVVQYLNIRCHPYDFPGEDPKGDPEQVRETARCKEEAVSKVSARQAGAIRAWLEAVRDSGVFYPDDIDSVELGHAIAYWSERDTEEGRESLS